MSDTIGISLQKVRSFSARAIGVFLLLVFLGAVALLPLLAKDARNGAPPELAWTSESAQKYPPTIVFMTDFGVVDDSVALCRGVMYSIIDGARFLYGATPYYPADTVFVVVIDPTVGSTRKAIVARSNRGQYFVLPDNGLLTLVEQRDGIEAVREITNLDWMIGSKL